MCKSEEIPVFKFNEDNPNEVMAFLDTTFTTIKDGNYHVCILN